MAHLKVWAFLAQLVEHPPCKRKVRGSIPRGGILFYFSFPHFFLIVSLRGPDKSNCIHRPNGIERDWSDRQTFVMNPVLFARTLRPALSSVRNVGMRFQNPTLARRSFMTLTSAQRAHMAGHASRNMFMPVIRREFASSGSMFNLPTRTLSFFVLSSVGIVGCFYVISYSLQVGLGVE